MSPCCVSKSPIRWQSSLTIPHLPNEVLAIIFEMLSDTDQHGTIFSCLQTCKLWQSLATPLLYRRLNLTWGRESEEAPHECRPRYERQTKLLSTLQIQVDLLAYIQELRIDARTYEARFVEVRSRVALRAVLPSLKRLALRGEGDDSAMSIATRVASLQLLEIDLRGKWSELFLSHLILNGSNDNLRHLRLQATHFKERWAINLPCGLPSDRRYVSGLQSLDLSNVCAPMRVIETVMAWPKALKSIDLDTVRDHLAQDFAFPSPSSLKHALDLQKHSLESIKLGQLTVHCADTMIDFSDFGQLKVLNLVGQHIFDLQPEVASLKLSAPKLETLVLDISQIGKFLQHSFQPITYEFIAAWVEKFLRSRLERYPYDSSLCVQLSLCRGNRHWTWNFRDSEWPEVEPVQGLDTTNGYIFVRNLASTIDESKLDRNLNHHRTSSNLPRHTIHAIWFRGHKNPDRSTSRRALVCVAQAVVQDLIKECDGCFWSGRVVELREANLEEVQAMQIG